MPHHTRPLLPSAKQSRHGPTAQHRRTSEATTPLVSVQPADAADRDDFAGGSLQVTSAGRAKIVAERKAVLERILNDETHRVSIEIGLKSAPWLRRTFGDTVIDFFWIPRNSTLEEHRALHALFPEAIILQQVPPTSEMMPEPFPQE